MVHLGHAGTERGGAGGVAGILGAGEGEHLQGGSPRYVEAVGAGALQGVRAALAAGGDEWGSQAALASVTRRRERRDSLWGDAAEERAEDALGAGALGRVEDAGCGWELVWLGCFHALEHAHRLHQRWPEHSADLVDGLGVRQRVGGLQCGRGGWERRSVVDAGVYTRSFASWLSVAG